MAGDIFAKERSAVTLTSTGASLTNLSAAAAGTNLDVRSAGNAAEDFAGTFELICQWATITGIVAGTIIGDLYLVPALDGTNFPDVDTTAGSSRISSPHRVGFFEASKAPTANTDMRFGTITVDLAPLLYKAYLMNRSGQTISANWTLKVVTARVQYT